MMVADDQGFELHIVKYLSFFAKKRKRNEMYILFLRKDPKLYHVLNQISKSDYNLNGRKLNFRMYHPHSTS